MPTTLQTDAGRGGQMALFGAIGLIGNLVGVALLYRARDASLNMRGAFLEVATDTVTSVGVLAAAMIATTGFTRADAIVSILVGLNHRAESAAAAMRGRPHPARSRTGGG